MRGALAASLLAVLSCGLDKEFECDKSSDCELGGVVGHCEDTGFCSFPDESCLGGRRYGEFAGDLAELCLDDQLACEGTVDSVIAGIGFTCTINTDSTVSCRGAGEAGQLGNNATVNSITPVTVVTALGQPLDAVDQLSAGRDYACAHTTGDQLLCWGDGANGRLGTRPDQVVPTAVQVEESPGVAFSARRVSAREGHTCATRANGTAWCWGLGSSGQLGDGGNLNQQFPIQVGLATIQDVQVGPAHTCARDGSGVITCWGDNALGQLGRGDRIDASTPVQVKRDAANNLLGVTQLALGTGHSCAVADPGTIFCWGDNSEGQLGDGSTTDRLFAVVAAFGEDAPGALVAGDKHTCIIRSADGAVLCWGLNNAGQLGAGLEADSQTRPVQVVDSIGVPLVDVVQLSSASNHTCALTGSGESWCWGSNSVGQLGRDPELLSSAGRAILVCP